MGFSLKTSPSGPVRLGEAGGDWPAPPLQDGGGLWPGGRILHRRSWLSCHAAHPTLHPPGRSPSPRPIFAQMPASLLTAEPQPRGTILRSLDGNTVGGNRPSQQAPSSQKRERPR